MNLLSKPPKLPPTNFWVGIRNISDYSPFGVLLKERTVESANFRRGFQGQERDDEIKGEGNSVNFKYRMHDPRAGRFFVVDPLSADYAYNSTYAFSQNIIINGIELEGLEVVPTSEIWDLNQTGVTASYTVADINYNSYKLASIHDHTVMLLSIDSGPNKGNYLGITINPNDISKFFDVFYEGKKNIQFQNSNAYTERFLIGKNRVKNHWHSGDIGSVSTGSPVLAMSEKYDYSAILGGLDGVEAMNTNLIGHFCETTGEWVDELTLSSGLMKYALKPWAENVFDPLSYSPGHLNLDLMSVKMKGSPKLWNEFQQATKGQFTGPNNRASASKAFNKWLTKPVGISLDPSEKPASTQEIEKRN